MIWVYGIHILITQLHLSSEDPAQLDFTMASFLKKIWNTVDTKSQGRLNLDDVTLLLRKLNIKLSKQEVKSAFKVRSFHQEFF